MRATEKVLVYECISGGGLGAIDAAPCGADARLLAQGVAMRDALAADLQHLDHLAVSCIASPAAPLARALGRVRPIRPGAASATDFLAEQAPHHDRVWVIAPESDGLLASLAEVVGSTRWVGCSVPAIRVAASKSETRAHLAAHGIEVPPAWRPGDGAPNAAGAWVVKPDDGAGSEDCRLHPNFAAARGDYLGRLAKGQPSVLESWIDGSPLSLSLLCSGGRAELLSINRQRIFARPGELLAYRGVDLQALPLDGAAGRTLADLAQRIAGALPGLAGYVGVDLVWRSSGKVDGPGGPVVIEINPRLTCAYTGLSAALGRNLAADILFARHSEALTHVLH